MNTTFPFGFPGPTAFYLVVYIVTLVIHVAFMHYVFAGTAVLAVGAMNNLITTTDRASQSPVSAHTLTAMLRDWMPFALSAAITAGVAPLLFLQILYKTNFYTANLLLFHRWMAVVPVLIIGFYMLYVLKAAPSETASNGRFTMRRVFPAIIAFACFLFTAWSWTENHLLSIAPSHWPAMYAANDWTYRNAALFPRLTLWFVGAFPTLCVILAWQVVRASKESQTVRADAITQLSRCAITALILTAAAAVGWYFSLNENARGNITGRPAGPYAALAIAGLVIQFAGWVRQRSRCKTINAICRSSLCISSAGALLTLIGGAVCRETVRLSSIDITAFYDQHRAASQIGGLSVFLLFFVINAGLIAWCFRLVRRGRT